MPPGGFFRTVPGLVIIVVTLALGASLPLAFGLTRSDPLGMLALTASAFFFFVGGPFVLSKFVFKEPFKNYGWRLPENAQKTAVYGVGVFLALLGPVLLLIYRPEFKAFYALDPSVPIALLFSLTALYFIAEEFLFRGFFFYAVRQQLPSWAITIDALLFGLLHFDKPPLEMAYAMWTAATLSWLTLKTGSFLPAAAVHFALATVLTVLVTVV